MRVSIEDDDELDEQIEALIKELSLQSAPPALAPAPDVITDA